MNGHKNQYILRYLVDQDNAELQEKHLGSTLGDMQQLVSESLPLTWSLMTRLSTDSRNKTIKQGNPRMILNAIMVLLYARNQKVNAFQTLIGVYLHVCHLQKSAIASVRGSATRLRYYNGFTSLVLQQCFSVVLRDSTHNIL